MTTGHPLMSEPRFRHCKYTDSSSTLTQEGESTVGDDPGERRLMRRLRALREARGLSQDKTAECMHMHPDSYRRIESGRHHLPDFRHGLIDWIRRFLECVGTSTDEQEEILALTAQVFVEQFAAWQRDLEHERKEPGSS